MTNYINEEILCEAYTKLNIDIFHDKEKLAELEKNLMSFFYERAKFYLGDDIQVRIEFEEGSLITKLTVIGGALLAITNAVAQYGSFRESVLQISQDATTLAQSANSEVIFRTKTAYCNRIDSERRKGVFGRADDLIRKLDNAYIKITNSKLPTNKNSVQEFNKTINNELSNWSATSDKFFTKLTDEATKACMAAGLLEELEKLPEEIFWEKELNGNGFRATVAKSDPELAGLIAGASSRYSAMLKEIKNIMKNRVNLYAPTKI